MKNINQLHGQEAGDEALAQVTQCIRLALADAMPDSPEIFLARYDGNGFVLLIPDCDLDRATGVAEDCRRSIAALELSKGLRVTVSVGVSHYRLWESAEDTLTRAEQALHLAKQFGRDRVEVTESSKPSAEVAEVIPLQRTA